MSKAYKMPTIDSLLQGGSINKKVILQEIGQNFMDFYVNNPVHQKDLRDKSNKNWPKWDVAKFTDLARKNPVHFLSQSSKFFHYDEVNKVFYLDDCLDQFLSPALTEHVKDILDYKTTHYFRRKFREEDDR